MQNKRALPARTALVTRGNLVGSAIIMAVVLSLSACETERIAEESPSGESVWAVDLIKLLPGGGDEYTANIENNWAQARDIALKKGDILSFRSLIAQPDSMRGWDLILMTEYTDSARWAAREEIFSQIFESTDYARVPTSRPSSELREFVAGGVVLKDVASSERP